MIFPPILFSQISVVLSIQYVKVLEHSFSGTMVNEDN